MAMMIWRSKEARTNLQKGLGKMDASLSTAEKIARRFKAGAPRRSDLFIRPIGAVADALRYADELAAALREAKLDPADCSVGVIFEVRGTATMKAIRAMGDGLDAVQAITQLEGVPRGLLLTITDREKGNAPIVWARAYLKDKKMLGDLMKIAKWTSEGA
jgi:hypothetical protein